MVELWSLDGPDAARGRRYAAIVIDEAAMVNELEKACTESLRPALADFRSTAWFVSTPRGIANHFHTLYQRGQDSERPEWKSWRLPTSTNPHIDAAEIAAARADMPERAYLQEFEAEFVSWEGTIFRGILDAVRAPARPCLGEVFIGVDWARASGGDFTVFLAIDVSGQVLEIDRFRGQEYGMQMALKALYEVSEIA